MHRALNFISIVLVAIALTFQPIQPTVSTVKAEPTAPTDVPVSLVSGGVWSYTLSAPKLFWNTGVSPCPPADANSVAAPQTESETIKRIATYGSTIRTVYSVLQACNTNQIQSNLVADADFVYWLSSNGLWRTSTNANAGDLPELVNALLSSPGELAMGSDKVYAIHHNSGGANTKVGYVLKSNKQKVDLVTPGNVASDLKFDGFYIYYRLGSNLVRLNPGVDVGLTIATNVTGYYPEGSRLIFCTISPFQCFYSNNVYVAKARSVYIYNNNNNTLGAAILTSSDTTASIEDLVTDFSHLFFIERRTTTCSPFCSYSYLINRSARNGGTVSPLYTYPATLSSGITHLTTDGTYLFFSLDDGSLQRLANDATALPSVNMSITGIEVTQGIQNLTNSVLLIKNKRTFVRVYVKATGSSVSGVTAQLEAPALAVDGLAPVNPVGTKITVRTTPDRNDINQSFLFELPWNWTNQNSLSLRATLNPYKVPLEPNYADDVSSVTVSFLPSPSLSVEFFRLNYTMGGKTYSPRIFDDVQKTYSWIMRAYPLGGKIGGNFKPRLWDVAGGTQLANWVNTTDPDCADVYGGTYDDISLCASYFTNGWLYYYRQATLSGDLNVGLNPNAFYYGMISDAAGYFPRGQAMYAKTSVGPAGKPGSGNWDTDGSYADWYAAHEIGHSLGRAHPNAGSDNPATDGVYENCGHSRSDPSFPYGNTSTARAPIGPSDNSMEGFDVGDPLFGIKPAVLPSATWNDLMSYCSYQWISNYTYTGMYTYMTLSPSLSTPAQSPTSTAVVGDFLVVSGAINTSTPKGGFSLIRRVNSVNSAPVIDQGNYALRLLDVNNNLLGSQQPIATTPSDQPNVLDFGKVITFQAGTRKIQLVRISDNLVLATRNISSNAPTVSNVALQSAPNPVSGIVTLNWSASDPDGDILTYDVSYTRDNGVSFQPVANNISTKTAQIDTAQLGGSGTARLRVTASDGVNTGFADSANFTMANKPPQPVILEPANNTQIHYGQLVNLSGMAFDAQDSNVADAGLVWKDSNNVVLGIGPFLTLVNLPVGSNVITLQATNSASQSASTTVTILVDDDLTLPGPTLSVGPATTGWQVPAGTTTLQSSLISIDNTGSGSMNWTAAKSANWFNLSATSGTVADGGDPSPLTISADPTGLPAGTVLSGQVTITKPASGAEPAQTVTIVVTLSVGPVRLTSPYSPSFFQFYLPTLRR